MSFLAPLFLVGAAAVIGPILFHLIRRATRERTLFSSLMFLKPTPPKLATRRRIEHPWLLLLRCLALALLAFAFARPFFRSELPMDNVGAAPGRLVVLVDSSASMRRDGVWERATSAALAAIERANAADHVSILTFDRIPRTILTFEEWTRTPLNDRVAMASARLAPLSPGWEGTRLGAALVAAAESILENEPAGPRGPRRVVLVSDMQEGSRLDGLQAYAWPKGVELEVIPVVARTNNNTGIAAVAEPADASAAAPRRTRVRVTNAPGSAREQFELRWASAAPAPIQPSPAVGAYVPAGQSRVFSMPESGERNRFDRVVLAGDDEPFDNVVFGAAPTQQTASVLWLGRDNPDDTRSPLFFVRRAYTDTPRVSVRVETLAPDTRLDAAALARQDLVFLADAVSESNGAAVREAVRNGRTAVVLLKSAADADRLAALLGVPELKSTEALPPKYAILAEIDFRHALFAPFADPRFSDFTKIHVWKHRAVDFGDVAGARTLARFDSGDAAIVEFPQGRGRVLVFTTGWQPEDSQIAVSSKFVPLMWSLLELGGARVRAEPQAFVGETVDCPPGTTGVRKPDGALVKLTSVGRFAGTTEPGVYRFVAEGRETAFAVNLDPNETRTQPLSIDELESLGVPVTIEGPAGTIAPKGADAAWAIEQESRQKLWRWAIVATLIVLLVETLAAGWLGGRAAETKEGATA